MGGWRVICWAVFLSAPLTFPIGAIARRSASDLHARGDAWLGFAYVARDQRPDRLLPLVRRARARRRGEDRPDPAVQPLLTLAWSALLLGEHIGAATIVASLGGTCERCGHPANQGDAEQSASLGNVGPVSEAAALEHISSGKVRDIYAVGRGPAAAGRLRPHLHLRRGAPDADPRQGQGAHRALGLLARARPATSCPNHLISFTEVPEEFRGRAMLVERLEMVPVECVVRGYITGSGWKDYQATGAVCGIELPGGPRESRAAARADLHARDEGRDGRPRRERRLRPRGRDHRRPRAARGAAPAVDRRSTSSAPSTRASAGSSWPTPSSSSAAGADGTIVLGDEVLTPDSSRFWPADGYEPGHGQPSFDKQYVRDWATGSGWDKTPPAPRAARTTWSRARASCTSTRTSASPASRSPRLAGALRVRARVSDPPEGGHPRSAGAGRRAGAAGARLRRRANVHVGRLIELDVEDAMQVPQMCERLLANPLIEDYEVESSPHEVRRRPLPGLLRRGRRAAWRAAASATPSSSGTATATCRASTRSSCPAASRTATTCASARSRASRR